MPPTLEYEGLHRLVRATGIAPETLVDVFRVERDFHRQIVAANSREERRRLIQEMYALVHPRLRPVERTDLSPWYRALAMLLRREVRGKTVLDLGCGDGSLLRAIASECRPRALCGIDIFSFARVESQPYQFITGDVVSFEIDHQFDVVISSEVLEHIPQQDLDSHFESVIRALRPRGSLIVLTPNRMWGPHDVTRLMDCSYSGRVPAQGSHLNELTYHEVVALLGAHGIGELRTVLPHAQHFPGLRSLRVTPYVNLALERSPVLRQLTYSLKRHGGSLYKNPIILVGRKL
jgi:2-polyprenyl-3-methyl-5-hydroxy-6-metoxy-1,4-benzoquinol methylase